MKALFPTEEPPRSRGRVAAAIGLLSALVAQAAPSASGSADLLAGACGIRVHDPSTPVHVGERWWLFGTGMGVRSWHSQDLREWVPGPPVFPAPPAWITNVVPSQRGYFWAPELIRQGDRYLLYYSVSSFGRNRSAIALASNATLDPGRPEYRWVDHGPVIESQPEDPFNAIDPAVFRDTDGSLWLVFGSFWNGIHLTPLDPRTGRLLDPDHPLIRLAWKEEIEAPALWFQEGWYYLFVNWGLCCRGVQSTYEIRVGRSRSITGPYVDREGRPMLEGGGTRLLGSEGAFVGPGHAAVFEADDRLWLSCHFYDGRDRGRSHLAILPLGFDKEGWPVVETLSPPETFLAPVPSGQTHRPWARWWWLGSAVDPANLTARLTQYRDAGFGGLEICPIYGVRGEEARHLLFLSEKWVRMLAHTLREARRLGLGIDLTTGTGWPFGGPWVGEEDASARLRLRRLDPDARGRVQALLERGRLWRACAVGEDGERIDLTDQVLEGGRLDWQKPGEGDWRVWAAIVEQPIQKVKRAAPGGEGWVVDPYSTNALGRYLARFDEALAGLGELRPRSHFHDSFEYFGASWSPALPKVFRHRHGYELAEHWLALAGEGDPDTVARVKHDFRETLAAMHGDYVRWWTDWAHRHGSFTRDQAHGAPANLLDLYAIPDIPETENFGSAGETSRVLQRLAASAAHLTGRALVSAEAFTWLNEHFQTSLASLKPAADTLFLAGINHLVYHGIPYSPTHAPWPGWQFYAAVNFGPDGGLWRDLPAFNAYVTRCQRMLQIGRPDGDLLLYFPFHDLLMAPEGLVRTFTVHNADEWLETLPFHQAALHLQHRGHVWDAVSARLLAGCRVRAGGLTAPGGAQWAALLVPQPRWLPLDGFREMLRLVREGATVLWWGDVPREVPGWGRLAQRRRELDRLRAELDFQERPDGLKEARLGRGRCLQGTELASLLEAAAVRRELMVALGLEFERRRLPDGWGYFIVNRGEQPVEGWVPLVVPARSAVLSDPSRRDHPQAAWLKADHGGEAAVYLQLDPGGSCLVRAWESRQPLGSPEPLLQAAGPARPLTGEWQVQFVEGGPELPAGFHTRRLGSWTEREDPLLKSFSGVARYTLEFDLGEEPEGVEDWRLDLGRVCESARVRLNGRLVAVLWHPPFRVDIRRGLRRGRNRLEIEVSNLPANRIAEMDRRGVPWKRFYDANVVDKAYRPFDASQWPPLDSGLLGPLTLQPLKRFRPELPVP